MPRFQGAAPLLGVLVLLLSASGAKARSAPAHIHDTGLWFTVEDPRDLPDFAIDGRCEPVAERPSGPGSGWEPGDGRCTLRAALDEINAAGGGVHHIVIPPMTVSLIPSMFWRHGLRVEPGVMVAISGAGASQSIVDAQFLQRILEVDSGASVSIRGLTLRLGRDPEQGGAILNRGSVHVSDSRFDSNVASSMFGAYGGAIFNEAGGVMAITTSTLAGNQARSLGGALYNDGYLTVADSTVAGNLTVSGGGAIANTGTAWIWNSTLTGNHMNGAVWNSGSRASIYLYSTTVANNSQPALLNATPHAEVSAPAGMIGLFNSIVYGSPTPFGTKSGWVLLPSGPIISFGFNLSSDTSCGFVQRGDQQGVDPKLGPLEDNGGPTWTHRLLPGSPALDEGFCHGTDQRGCHRPVKIVRGPHARNGCDIGALEVQRYEAR